MKVHYKGYVQKFDEWIERNSPRIAPYGRNKSLHHQKKTAHQWRIPPTPGKTADDDRTRQIIQYSDKYSHYLRALQMHGLRIVEIPGDGNCLFRAISHQVYGNDNYHHIVRAMCVDYMAADAEFFSQFVEGGKENFNKYLAAKRTNACWGDDPEIQAICELYDRPAEIWAYDSAHGARKLRTFHEVSGIPGMTPMRVSYYGGGHYDSVVGSDHASSLLTVPPGTVEKQRIEQRLQQVKNASNIRVSDSSVRPFRSGIDPRFSEEKLSIDILDECERMDIEKAINTSRNEMEAWGDEDLEMSLAMSMAENDLKKTNDIIMIKTYDSNDTNNDLNNKKELKSNELNTVSGINNISTVSSTVENEERKMSSTEQLENEELEKALKDSITENQIREEAHVQAVSLLSLKEAAAANACSNDNNNMLLDEEMALALELSCMENMDDLNVAIKKSLEDTSNTLMSYQDVHDPTSKSYFGTSDDADEDEMLRAAMVASLSTTNHSINNNNNISNNNNNILSDYQLDGNLFDNESPEDIELRLAIEMSLKERHQRK